LAVAVVALLGLVGPREAWSAPGRVELNIVTDRNAPLTAQQTWARALGAAGIRSVRLRSARTNDKIGIEVRGSKQSPIYVVTGKLDGRGDVVLPGGRYRQSQAGKAAAWLKELARLGPPESREPIVAFDLPRSQMVAVHEDLSHRISFSTKGLRRDKAIGKVLKLLKLPVDVDPKSLKTTKDDLVTEDLHGLSCGTALAYLLDPLGLVLIPRTDPKKGPYYAITIGRGKKEVWPVGWKPEKSPGKLVPKLAEFVSVSLPRASVGNVFDKIAGRLKLPVLTDRKSLAAQRIDPEKVFVTIPRERMTYDTALDRILFKARIKYELRTDEAGAPFLWVTALKPPKKKHDERR
jgi:hypothetical protein